MSHQDPPTLINWIFGSSWWTMGVQFAYVPLHYSAYHTLCTLHITACTSMHSADATLHLCTLCTLHTACDAPYALHTLHSVHSAFCTMKAFLETCKGLASQFSSFGP